MYMQNGLTKTLPSAHNNYKQLTHNCFDKYMQDKDSKH